MLTKGYLIFVDPKDSNDAQHSKSWKIECAERSGGRIELVFSEREILAMTATIYGPLCSLPPAINVTCVYRHSYPAATLIITDLLCNQLSTTLVIKFLAVFARITVVALWWSTV